MPEKKLVCQECGKRVANSNNVLARHIRSAHGMEWSDYVVKHEFDGQWPVCSCGCGEELAWKKGGFGQFIKGHDNKGKQNSMSGGTIDVTLFDKGWVPNPFTGREEHMDTQDEAAFLLHCVQHDDPITKDHGFKIGWEDASGELRIVTPNFMHLKQRAIIMLDTFDGDDGPRRLKCVKEWCDEHKFMLLIMVKTTLGFDVIGGHRPEEMDGRDEIDTV